jgi:glucose/arabinose dehydrogenase
MDDVKYNGKDVHNENPAEKMNYHGVLNSTSNSFKGANYGYPSCVSAWDPSLLGGNLAVGDLFKADGTPAATDCASRQKPRTVFPSHTAPLDIKFRPNSTAAYISFHGSWCVVFTLVYPLAGYLQQNTNRLTE